MLHRNGPARGSSTRAVLDAVFCNAGLLAEYGQPKSYTGFGEPEKSTIPYKRIETFIYQ